MNSRGNNTQFRSVRLVQRGDLGMLTDRGRFSTSYDGGSSYAALRDHSSPYESDGQDRPSELTAAERLRERRQKRHEEERASRRFKLLRRERHTETKPHDPEPRDSETSRSVSVYPGESTVVSVTSRSERSSRVRPSGFTLVPPVSRKERTDEKAAHSRQTGPDRHSRSTGVGAAAYGVSHNSHDDASPAWSTFQAWADGSIALDDRQPYFESQRESFRSSRSSLDGQTVRRDWLYTGDDDDPRETPGASRRREAVVGAVRAVPQALASGATGLASIMLTHARGLLVLALAAFTAFMLYAPARELYVANRRLDTLQATYDVLIEENDAIRDDLELLQTREGIENEARARGYVEAGETKVIVEGLPESAPTSNPTAFMNPIELPDNRPWYIRMLDEFFDYEAE